MVLNQAGCCHFARMKPYHEDAAGMRLRSLSGTALALQHVSSLTIPPISWLSTYQMCPQAQAFLPPWMVREHSASPFAGPHGSKSIPGLTNLALQVASRIKVAACMHGACTRMAGLLRGRLRETLQNY
jgi:hypothetical protein